MGTCAFSCEQWPNWWFEFNSISISIWTIRLNLISVRAVMFRIKTWLNIGSSQYNIYKLVDRIHSATMANNKYTKFNSILCFVKQIEEMPTTATWKVFSLKNKKNHQHQSKCETGLQRKKRKNSLNEFMDITYYWIHLTYQMCWLLFLLFFFACVWIGSEGKFNQHSKYIYVSYTMSK